MQLRIENGIIALPADFKLEITTNHPFFSDDGSASTPATIPASMQNREILDYPENPNRRRRFTRVLDGVLAHKTYFKPCKVIVSGASKSDGISVSIALRESGMYAEIQDYRLQDLFAQYRVTSRATTPWYFYADARVGALSDFTFFPVAADLYESGNTQRVNIINRPLSDKTFAYAARTVQRGASETIAAPDGYGLAPYMYLRRVLALAFQYCGYTVVENVFATDHDLSRIVLLHRYADLLVPAAGDFDTKAWTVSGEHMVPNITVGELITFIHDKFGAFVTVRGRNVSIRLFCDIVEAGYDADLSGAVLGEVSVSYPEPKSLTLTQQTGIDSGAPAADSLESLRNAYQALTTCETVEDIQGTGLFYIETLGKYYHRKVDGDGNPVVTMVGSDAFDFKRTVPDVDEEEELGPDDVFAPMVYVKSAGLYMPYIGESVHQTITIEGKESQDDDPIILCLANYYRDDSDLQKAHCQGQTVRHTYGVVVAADYFTTTPCTPEGAVSRFWTAWWSLLADGAPELSCRLKLPLEQLESMDLFTVKRLNGCRVLIKSIKYALGPGGVSDCEAVFQLLTKYEDGRAIPAVTFSSHLTWLLVSTRRYFPYGDSKNGCTILETDGLDDYTDDDAPDFQPTRIGIKAKARKRWLRYRTDKTTRWKNIFQPYDHTSSTGTETYEEYFISIQQE